MITENFPLRDNAIYEIRLSLNWHELVIPADKIGLFQLTGIKKVMSKQVTSETCYKAEGMLLELHADCVGEIEMLVKEYSKQNSIGIGYVYVSHLNARDEEEYIVYEASRKFKYFRVNSQGDLRIILGNPHGWPMVDTYEASPICFFDVDEGLGTLPRGVYAEVPELVAKNYKYLVYKRMRRIHSIIEHIQIYAGITSPRLEFFTDPKLVMYLSIFDSYIERKYGNSLYIHQYTYYDDDDCVWRNNRIDFILDCYRNAKPSTEYEEDIQKVCQELQGKSSDELGMVYFRFCCQNADEKIANGSIWKD